MAQRGPIIRSIQRNVNVIRKCQDKFPPCSSTERVYLGAILSYCAPLRPVRWVRLTAYPAIRKFLEQKGIRAST